MLGTRHQFQYGAGVTLVHSFLSCPHDNILHSQGPSCSRDSSALSAEPDGSVLTKCQLPTRVCADSSLLSAVRHVLGRAFPSHGSCDICFSRMKKK